MYSVQYVRTYVLYVQCVSMYCMYSVSLCMDGCVCKMYICLCALHMYCMYSMFVCVYDQLLSVRTCMYTIQFVSMYVYLCSKEIIRRYSDSSDCAKANEKPLFFVQISRKDRSNFSECLSPTSWRSSVELYRAQLLCALL